MAPFLAALLPYLGSAAAGYAGSKLASLGSNQSGNQPSGNFVTGYGARNEQVPLYSQDQSKVFDQLRGLGLQGVQKGFDFAPIEQQARQNFQRQTIPSISERFAGSGGSSAYGDQISQAGKDLELGLAGLKSGYGLQQQGMYQNLLGLGLQPQFQTMQHQAEPGLAQSLPGPLLAALPALLQALGYLGGGQQGGTQQSPVLQAGGSR